MEGARIFQVFRNVLEADSIWHGCPKCTKPGDKVPNNDLTMSCSYYDTLEKIRYLEQVHDYKVIQLWSCENEKMKKQDPEYADFCKDVKAVEALKPRDALKGGRTNAIKLHHKCSEQEKIHYVDICRYVQYC